MRAYRERAAVVLSGLALVLACASAWAQSPPPGLILQADEGERRTRRTGDFPFILKVDKKNGWSADMVMGMEDLKPGQAIPTHRHLHADEIVFIHKGTAEVTLGEQKAIVREGGTVYIPRHVRIALKNPGPATLTIVFIFPKPGFEDYPRHVCAGGTVDAVDVARGPCADQTETRVAYHL
jgi:oxalate decarboxylase/phosphoglucose isomerase-like protein (cupin superfamily)